MTMVLPIYYFQYLCEMCHLTSCCNISNNWDHSFLVFTDYGIYWVHRTLHHPSVYKYVHKPHHKWLSMSLLPLLCPSLTLLPSSDPFRFPRIPPSRRLYAICALPSVHISLSAAPLALSGSFRVCEFLEYSCTCSLHILTISYLT